MSVERSNCDVIKSDYGTKLLHLAYANRVCRTSGTIEDEYHIIIDCPRFSTPRQK